MAFCKQCGKQLDDAAKFCMSCGSPVEAIAASSPVHDGVSVGDNKPNAQPNGKKRSIIPVVAVAVLSVLLVCGAAIGYQWYNSGEQQVLRALDSGEFEQAIELVSTDETLRESEELADVLTKRIDKLLADYNEETIEYSDALLEINTIRQMNVESITNKLDDTAGTITALNQSRTCFSSAETFFENGDYAEAMALYAQVIEADQNYEQARSQYSECVRNYREGVLAQASEYAAEENYIDALLILNSALVNLPEDSIITEQILVYTKAKDDATKAYTLSQAAEFAATGDYENAKYVLENYLFVHGDDPDVLIAYDDYCAKHEEAIKRAYLAEASYYAEAADYRTAMSVLEAYMAQNGEDADVQTMYNEYFVKNEEAIKTTYLANAAGYAEDGNYRTAISVLEEYMSLKGESADVQNLYNDYCTSFVESVLASAQESVTNGDYAAAFEILSSGLEVIENDDEMLKLLKGYEDAYVTDVLNQSAALTKEEAYDDALALVRSALSVLPDHEKLLAESDRIYDIMPHYLLDVCTAYEYSDFISYMEGEIFSMSGYTCTNGFVLRDTGYVYFNLYGEYDILGFFLGHVDGSDMYENTVTIYLDGVAYTTITVGASELPQYITLDVSGVKQLVFETGDGTWWPYCGFAEVTVQKKPN